MTKQIPRIISTQERVLVHSFLVRDRNEGTPLPATRVRVTATRAVSPRQQLVTDVVTDVAHCEAITCSAQ